MDKTTSSLTVKKGKGYVSSIDTQSRILQHSTRLDGGYNENMSVVVPSQNVMYTNNPMVNDMSVAIIIAKVVVLWNVFMFLEAVGRDKYTK